MIIVIDKEKETWKDLNAYNIVDKYEISNYGNIRKRKSKKIVKNYICNDGYRRVSLKTYTSEKHAFLVHRLVAFTFVDGYNIESGKIIVNHRDSIRSHAYYENLEWVTYAENIKHGYEHGRIIKYKQPKSVIKNFDDNILHNICKYLESGYPPSKIYKMLNTDKYSKKSIADLIYRIKKTGIDIYSDVINQYNIPTVNRQIDLDVELVETICDLLSQGYYTEDIISILKIPSNQVKKYQKNICDIKQRKTFTNISSKYIFPLHIYKRKPRYPLNATIEICEYLQNNIPTPEIVNYIINKYEISNSINLRDYIYDIKRRRIHTGISKSYIW